MVLAPAENEKDNERSYPTTPENEDKQTNHSPAEMQNT